jgi:histidinol-phosphate aminotransferase
MLAQLDFHPPGRSEEEVARAYGVPAERILRLGSNENAYGPSPRAVAAITAEAGRVNGYPGGLYQPLRELIAKHNGVDEAEVEIGPGAEAIIHYLAMLFIEPLDELVIQRQSFDAAPWAVTEMGGVVRYVDADAYAHDLDAFAAQAGPRTKLMWITSPDNPSGTIVRRGEIDRFLDRVPAHIAVVFDQAYREYVDDPEYGDALAALTEGHRNVIVLRTFSKAYGLAGLRLGYLLADRVVCEALRRLHEPFHVNRLAAAAGSAALEDQAWMRDVVARTQGERARLSAELAEVGFGVIPSQANFVLVRLDEETAGLPEELLRRGVIVRRPDKWGYDRHVRITVGRPEQTDRLLEELHDIGI